MAPAFGNDTPVAVGVTICRSVEDPPTDFTVYDGVTEAAITFPPVEDTEMAGCKTGLGDAGSLCPSVVNADLAVSRCGRSAGPMVVTCSGVGLAAACGCAVLGARSIGCSPLSGGFSSTLPGAFCTPDILAKPINAAALQCTRPKVR